MTRGDRNSGVASYGASIVYGALVHVPPLDFQQFYFFSQWHH